MALTQSQVSQLYVTLFGRASEGAGNTYWQEQASNLADGADQMLATDAAADYFQEALDDNQAFIEHIYSNTLGKSYEEDPDGIDYWTSLLEGGTSRGVVTAALIEAVYDYADSTDADAQAAYQQFVNRVEVSNYCANNIPGDDLDASDADAMAVYSGYINGVTDDSATVDDATDAIDDDSPDGVTYTLTANSDEATANIFIADMVYTPDGSDRILSLQDEDELTGTEGRTDNTLYAELGNTNADEGTTGVVTPELNNIQIINLEWTGNTATFDARYADSITTLNIDKITADATAVLVDNLTTPAAELTIANAAAANTDVTFQYLRGVLDGTGTLDLTLDSVYMDDILQDATGAATLVEGFSTVELEAINGVEIDTLTVNQMESLIITGSGYLDIVDLTATAPVSAVEYDLLAAGAIGNPSAVGLLELDASGFDGDLTLDITNALGGFADPDNSGAIVHTVVTGSTGDDTFWTGANATATTTAGTTVRDMVDMGDGDDTLVTTANIAENASGETASFTSVETLELRNQTAGASTQTVDFDAFDGSLTSVVMRSESTGVDIFQLNDLGADLAADGLELRHGISGSGSAVVGASDVTVNVELADASGADDLVSITVENDLNTTDTFNYTLNFDGDDADGDSFTTDGAVENVTIIDNDTEDNIVFLTKAAEHTGTITLSGGVAGDEYTIDATASTLVAATIDASAQLSDLRITVGDTTLPITDVDQTINLGSGDDILTFANIGDFNGNDTITDAGGDDTVRAAFDEDADLTLTDIESLHIIANANVELGMANADVDQLVILADIAADGDTDASPDTDEPFTVVPATTNIITLTDTSLTELNFFADLDNDDDNTTANRAAAEAAAVLADATWTGIGTSALGDAAYKLTISDESTTAIFNGVTLANNSAETLTVNINSSLDDVIYGATAYNIGQITAHGVTSMDIVIADEDVTAGAANAVTTINNIYAKNMTSLTVTAEDDVILGTVSGAALNNSLLTLDASAVGGDFTAVAISLGDDAVVTLGDGDNTFSALGSAGKDITITAGDGNNTITGSAQDDTISTGSGWDRIVGDRGDNVIESGAGNDQVSGKDGNDTYDVGTGIDTVVDNWSTLIDASLATNTVSMSGGVASVTIDVDGSGVLTAADIAQSMAVGVGSDLTISWTGATILDNSAVLDGSLATVHNVAGAAAVNGDANANLVLVTGAGSTLASTLAAGLSTGVKTVSTAGGNDVVMWTGSAAGDALVFSGGAGNDAAVGTIDEDIFTGGAGADMIVLADNATGVDGIIDTVVIADGDSSASAYDRVVGFDMTPADVAAVGAGSSTAGADILDLAAAFAVEAVVAAGIDGTNVGDVETHLMAANGVITFGTDDTDATFNDDIVQVGTGATQISLEDALGYLAANATAGATYMFTYDANGDGVLNASDSTFIFQEGATDTVVELVGVIATGVEAAGLSAADTLVNIA